MRRAHLHLFVFVIIETESFHLMSAYFLEGFVEGMRRFGSHLQGKQGATMC
jgi:hypothetical protein